MPRKLNRREFVATGAAAGLAAAAQTRTSHRGHRPQP